MLEDIARAFIQGAERDPLAAESFADIGAALIPRVSMSSAVAVARMLAGRKDVPAPVLAALAARGLRPKGVTPAADPPRPKRKRVSRAPATPADGAARERMIADAARLAHLDAPPDLRRRADSIALLALARASERRDREDVVAILARVLGLPAAALDPLFDETSGELVAIACRAAGLEDADAIRIFVGVGPAATRSGAGLQEAMTSFQSLDRPTAARLLRTITRDEPEPLPAAQETAARSPRRQAAAAATLSPRSTAQSGLKDPKAATPASRTDGRNRG
ncbi:MAG: hypothetical protein J0H41_00485 [Rhizobiales bacterium]|nr:hypothetical protein [Hyphomicrobiales bacterium]